MLTNSFGVFFFAFLVGVATVDGQISAFSLVDTTTNAVLQEVLNDGDVVVAENEGDLGRFGIVATADDDVGSVLFDLDDGARTQTENIAPFALFGDMRGDFNDGELTVGSHSLTATAFELPQGNGDFLDSLTIDFVVALQDDTEDIDEPEDNNNMAVTSFILVDTVAEVTLRPLVDGDVVQVESVNDLSRFGIVAEKTIDVGSVVFDLDDGDFTQTENVSSPLKQLNQNDQRGRVSVFSFLNLCHTHTQNCQDLSFFILYVVHCHFHKMSHDYSVFRSLRSRSSGI